MPELRGGGGSDSGGDRSVELLGVARIHRASAAKLREMQERDLSAEDVVAMVVDGKSFADATMVVALGITISGEKRFLGFVETDTENEQVLTPFLRSLRGLDVSQGLLVVIDGYSTSIKRGAIRQLKSSGLRSPTVNCTEWQQALKLRSAFVV